jgi:hypothetical protein
LGDALENTVRIAQHVVVPEAQYAKARCFNEATAILVVNHSISMLSAVQLNDELLRKTGEVHEVRPDRHLTPPFEISKLGP